MVVGEVSTSTDVLVIGGGPGGYAAAIRCSQLGHEVTLIERDAVGGTCLNVGCIPSKVLIHAAELAHLPGTTAGTGVSITASVNVPELQRHMQRVVGDLTGGVSQLLEHAKVTVIPGTARFSRRNRVAVVDGDAVQHIEFTTAIIATGSRPIELPNLPFADHRVVSSTGALFEFESAPENLVVVGGGYIGVELGTAWSKLGSRVTIVEAESSLLPGLDPRIGRTVERRMQELDIRVLTNTRADGLDDQNHMYVTGADQRVLELPADRVVVCVGRMPNTDDLGLDVVGVELDADGRIPVDAGRRAAKNILAIGDVTPGPALAHKATAEAEVAARTAAGQPAAFDPAGIPAVVFSDPEVATVGLTLDEAKAAGVDAKRSVFPLSASSRARTLTARDVPLGQMELVTDTEGTVLGAHLVGPHAAELIGEITLAMEMAATVEEIAATIHPHPTMSEGLLEAAHGALGLPLHTI